MTKYTYTEKKDTRSGFGVGLHEAGKEDENVIALCADLKGSLKMDAFADEFPERYFSASESAGLPKTVAIICRGQIKPLSAEMVYSNSSRISTILSSLRVCPGSEETKMG